MEKYFYYTQDCYRLGTTEINETELSNLLEHPYNYHVIKIEYIKGTLIGKLSRQANQCYGTSERSRERNKRIILSMLSYKKQFNFEQIK